MIQIQIKYLLVALICCVVTQVPAQQIPSRSNEGVRRNASKLDQLKEYQQLHLSTAQQQKLRSLQKERRQKVAAIRTDPQLTADDKKEKMKLLLKEQSEKRNALLTLQQQKTWRELALAKKQKEASDIITVDQRISQTDTKHDRNGLPQKNLSPGRNLTLTQAQRQKMTALNTWFREKAAAIKNNTALTDDQKKEQQTAIQKEMRRQRKGILTPEQWQQRKALNSQQKRSAINF